MVTTLILLKKEIRNEWRNLYQLGGLLSFLCSVCYLIYFFAGKPDSNQWNLLYWLSYLFLCFFIGSRVYEDDQTKYRQIINQLVHPINLMISKVIFVFFFLMFINMMILSLFAIFIPSIEVDFVSWLMLCILLNIGMSVLITFTALLNAYARNNTLFLTILILPLSFPLIGMSFSIAKKILEGQRFFAHMNSIQLLGGIDLMILALSLLIVPQIIRS